MNRTYRFSIVTAVYNTADYLDEMIESVINQDIGFKENVQLILVDDGSSDDSERICLKYYSKYPENIIYLKCKHEGVSNARNKGIEWATGLYVNFLDSDDKLEKNALSECDKFLMKHINEVDLVAIPLYFFGKVEGQHILNYKFEESRVIDIIKEYNYIQLSSSSTFIKRHLLEKYKFNKKLKYAEDAEIITNIILEKGKYGVVNTSKYYYRRREDSTSATQDYKRKEWYLDYIYNFSYKMSIKNVGSLYTKYLQYLVMYDLQWRINDIKFRSLQLGRDNVNTFFDILKSVLDYISVAVIFEQKNISLHRKILLTILKVSKSNTVNNIVINLLCSL